jgi:hypothetical protein
VSVKRRESLSRKVRLNCCADFFGRISLGKIRGMGSLVTSLFSAGGPPFFGLLFDYTESSYLSFNIFIGMLFTSPCSVCACDRRRNNADLLRHL